ncbi:unnamed protein product [Nippostrongylus brasiliensis]|uniref:Dynein light chain n=1 Tax=Nippostrongylus brasiliensis TaxID=27835 RepID=A0A0N4Y1L4_NIPBR|nr:hypothetical protein Q1695_001676 [Nippostrongylus brasiliensis]VDL73107.1 unnamed protein product [Nippostrongylus brasiliensis]
MTMLSLNSNAKFKFECGKSRRDAVVIKTCDMSVEMQEETIEIAFRALDRCRIEKDIAACIKQDMDRKFYPSWQCVVGRNFGSYVTHETHCFIYFYVHTIAIMVFKTSF